MKCTICNSPQRASAEAALGTGESVRKLAKRLGLSYYSLDRHSRNCVREAVSAAVARREDNLGGALVVRVEELATITDEVIQDARKAEKPILVLKGVAQARKNLELIGRLTGELKPAEDEGPKLVTFEEFEALYVRARREVQQ